MIEAKKGIIVEEMNAQTENCFMCMAYNCKTEKCVLTKCMYSNEIKEVTYYCECGNIENFKEPGMDVNEHQCRLCGEFMEMV